MADFGLRVPADALAAVATFVHQRAQGREALVQVGSSRVTTVILRCSFSGMSSRSPFSSRARRKAGPFRPPCHDGVSTTSFPRRQI